MEVGDAARVVRFARADAYVHVIPTHQSLRVHRTEDGQRPLQFICSAGRARPAGRSTSFAAGADSSFPRRLFGSHRSEFDARLNPGSASAHASFDAHPTRYTFPASTAAGATRAPTRTRNRTRSTLCRRIRRRPGDGFGQPPALAHVAPLGTNNGAASRTSPNSVTSLICRNVSFSVFAPRRDTEMSCESSADPKRATSGVSSVRFACKSRQFGSQSALCSYTRRGFSVGLRSYDPGQITDQFAPLYRTGGTGGGVWDGTGFGTGSEPSSSSSSAADREEVRRRLSSRPLRSGSSCPPRRRRSRPTRLRSRRPRRRTRRARRDACVRSRRTKPRLRACCRSRREHPRAR